MRATEMAEVLSAISRARQEFVQYEHFGHETAGVRFGGREHAPRVGPFQRFRDADNPQQKPSRARFGHDAAACEHEAETRGAGSETDVHRQQHCRADADCCAIDRSDERFQGRVQT